MFKLLVTKVPSANILRHYDGFLSKVVIVCNDRMWMVDGGWWMVNGGKLDLDRLSIWENMIG
jgi:hypothetical protein